MNMVDLDRLVERAASKELRQRQHDTFALMEPSVHMPLEAFRQIADLEQSDYTSVRTVLGAFAEMARPRTYLEIGTRRGHSASPAFSLETAARPSGLSSGNPPIRSTSI